MHRAPTPRTREHTPCRGPSRTGPHDVGPKQHLSTRKHSRSRRRAVWGIACAVHRRGGDTRHPFDTKNKCFGYIYVNAPWGGQKHSRKTNTPGRTKRKVGGREETKKKKTLARGNPQENVVHPRRVVNRAITGDEATKPVWDGTDGLRSPQA